MRGQESDGRYEGQAFGNGGSRGEWNREEAGRFSPERSSRYGGERMEGNWRGGDSGRGQREFGDFGAQSGAPGYGNGERGN
ncbi:MAG: hypothetical protein ABI054_10275, partial [Planctomycetota bacterium]